MAPCGILRHNKCMNPRIADALNEQMNRVFNAAFLYLACSVDLKEYGMSGAGHWMRMHYHSECAHALGLLDYMGQRRVAAKMPNITPTKYTWESPTDLFRLAKEHEKVVTNALDNLIALCREERDFATEQQLLSVVHRRVQIEDIMDEILRDLLRCGKDSCALLQLDEKIGRSAGQVIPQLFPQNQSVVARNGSVLFG